MATLWVFPFAFIIMPQNENYEYSLFTYIKYLLFFQQTYFLLLSNIRVQFEKFSEYEG